MDILLIIIASIGILLQFILDHIDKTKTRKKIVGITIVACTLAGLWGSYAVQKGESKELNSTLDTLKYQNSQLGIDLGKRDSSLNKIRSQNEFLIDLMIALNKEQKKTNILILARNITEASRVSDVRDERNVIKPNREFDREAEKKMISLLSSYKGSKITLNSIMGNQEAFVFAKRLKDILSSAGWVVDGVNQAIYTSPIIGTFVKVKNQQYPKRVDAIAESFKVAGIPLEGFMGENIGSDDVEIIIGELKK